MMRGVGRLGSTSWRSGSRRVFCEPSRGDARPPISRACSRRWSALDRAAIKGWQLAEAAGDRTPDGVQDFLARMRWDADEVRDDLQG
jgi:hypothetical protein